MDFKKHSASVREVAGKRTEDNEVFYKEHLKQLVNDGNISEIEITPDSLPGGGEFYELAEKEYKLARFSEVNFGKADAASEDDFVKVLDTCFYYCDFTMCGFNNIAFINCAFVGCKFIECYTLGLYVIFDNCSFTSRISGKKSIDDMPSAFKSCEFSARFSDCDISQMVLDKCHYYFSHFDNVDLCGTIFLDCSFDTTKLTGCDMRGTKLINPRFIEFYIEDSGKKSRVDRKTFLGFINYNRKEEREIKYAAEVYVIFSELFENNKLLDMQGEYFYLNKTTELHILRGFDRFKSILGLITCGYGERPSFSLITSLFLILICGTLYMLFGVNYNNEILVFHPSAKELAPPLGKLVLWYHFSLVTFSTVGYGNVTPIGGSLLVSAVEMVSGVIMVGIWVSTLVRKMVR